MASGAKWACFTTWNGGFITANGQFSDEHTEADILIKDYQSEYVLTLDELPDWDNLIDEPIEGDVNADETFNVNWINRTAWSIDLGHETNNFIAQPKMCHKRAK